MYLVEKKTEYKLNVTLDKFYLKRLVNENTGEVFKGYIYFEEEMDSTWGIYVTYLYIFDETREKILLLVPVRISDGRGTWSKESTISIPKLRKTSDFPLPISIKRSMGVGLVYMTVNCLDNTKPFNVYRMMVEFGRR